MMNVTEENVTVEVFLKSNISEVDAFGEYNTSDNSLLVKKGSKLSKQLSESKSFRGKNAIIAARKGNVNDGTLLNDVNFGSPSTAANFVTGKSTNGIRSWKTKDGIPIKKLIAAKKEGE